MEPVDRPDLLPPWAHRGMGQRNVEDGELTSSVGFRSRRLKMTAGALPCGSGMPVCPTACYSGMSGAEKRRELILALLEGVRTA